MVRNTTFFHSYYLISIWREKEILSAFTTFCPQAQLALPFPIDEKEAKI
jgi:hypothetical protein